MKKTIKKEMYAAPVTELYENLFQPIMINIGSGETTPEESDANESLFEDVDDYCSHSTSLWDDDL